MVGPGFGPCHLEGVFAPPPIYISPMSIAGKYHHGDPVVDVRVLFSGLPNTRYDSLPMAVFDRQLQKWLSKSADTLGRDA